MFLNFGFVMNTVDIAALFWVATQYIEARKPG